MQADRSLGWMHMYIVGDPVILPLYYSGISKWVEMKHGKDETWYKLDIVLFCCTYCLRAAETT